MSGVRTVFWFQVVVFASYLSRYVRIKDHLLMETDRQQTSSMQSRTLLYFGYKL